MNAPTNEEICEARAIVQEYLNCLWTEVQDLPLDELFKLAAEIQGGK